MSDINKYFTMSDAMEILDDIVQTNHYNRKNKFSNRNIAVEFIGERGIGKTEAVEQYAKKNKYGFHCIELAQITDETALYGYPRKTFRVSKKVVDKDGVEKILRGKVESDRLDSVLKDGFVLDSKESELTYSTPEWVNNLAKYEKSILYLDEMKRALPHIIQATMNLVNFGRFGNWSLPEGCTVVLTNNPNDGDYNVSSLDLASNDRMLTFHIKPDIESWVQWATVNNIQEECINFLYKTPEARDGKDKPSYRMWTNFFMTLNKFNIRDSAQLPSIYRLGTGSVGEQYTLLFKTFVTQNLDILPSLKWVFDKNTSVNDALSKLKACVYSKNADGQNVVRNDIKGLIGVRMRAFLRSDLEDSSLIVNRLSLICAENVLPKDSLMAILLDISSSNNHPNKQLLKEIVKDNTLNSILINNNINTI